MILAVVGSRLLEGSHEAKHIIEDWVDMFSPDLVVSGGAPGIDTMAEEVAREKNKMMEVFPADWETLGKSAGFQRNTQIAMRADHVLGIMIPGGTAGTKDTLTKAMKLGKPVTIYTIEPKVASKKAEHQQL